MTARTSADGSGRGARVLATLMWSSYVVGTVVTAVVRSMAHVGLWSAFILTFGTFATVGWLIAVRRARTPIAWVFLTIGVLTSLGIVTDAFVSLGLHRGWRPHGPVLFAAWVQMWYWYPLLVLSAPYTLLLFPSGLPSRRWRPVLWLLTAALAMMTVSAALMPNIDWGKKHVHNPIGLPVHVKDIEKTPLFGVAGVLLIVCVVASVASLAVRFRRSHGIERAQLKWFFLGSTLLGVNVVGSMVSTSFNNSAVSSVLTPFALSAMPFACGLAVLRYRLYDIDRVVSRTVSYAIVTGAIVGLYVGAVALADGVLGFSSNVAVAASTLAAAAAFQPLRRRVQHAVDRRFDRAAYDARRVADAFSLRLRNAVDVDRVTGDLLSTVATAVAPANASVWLVTE